MVFARIAGLRYLQLVIFFFLYLMLLSWIQAAWLVKAFTLALLMNVLMVTISDSRRAMIVKRVLWAMLAVTLVSSVIEEFSISASVSLASQYVRTLGAMLLALVCVWRVLDMVFRAEKTTIDSVFASMVAYQFIGFVFAQAFMMIALADPASIRLPDTGAAVAAQVGQLDMLYFSFVTLATLGYGDILAVSPFARSIAIMEAIVGQFYVAIIVAILVSGLFADAFQARRGR